MNNTIKVVCYLTENYKILMNFILFFKIIKKNQIKSQDCCYDNPKFYCVIPDFSVAVWVYSVTTLLTDVCFRLLAK